MFVYLYSERPPAWPGQAPAGLGRPRPPWPERAAGPACRYSRPGSKEPARGARGPAPPALSKQLLPTGASRLAGGLTRAASSSPKRTPRPAKAPRASNLISC